MQVSSYTGNAFVDAGNFILAQLNNKELNKLVKQDFIDAKPKLLTYIYTANWMKNIRFLFPNSSLVQNVSDKERKNRYEDNIDILIKTIEPLDDSGNCAACGRRKAKHFLRKTQLPLSAGGFNFYSHCTEGLPFCAACALSIQFMPLYLYYCGGKFILLHSNDTEIMELTAEDSLNYKNGAIIQAKLHTAVFNLIIMLATKQKIVKDNSSIVAYVFTNDNRGADVKLINIPCKLYRFIKRTYPYLKDEWETLIEHNWIGKEKKDKPRPNRIHVNLLEGRNIITNMLDNKNRRTLVSIEFLEIYCLEILELDAETVRIVKDIGHKIAELVRHQGHEKRFLKIERAKKYPAFRNQLLLAAREWKSFKEKEVFFPIDYYVDLLNNINWWDARDLLRLCVYEYLNDWYNEKDEKELAQAVQEIEEEDSE